MLRAREKRQTVGYHRARAFLRGFEATWRIVRRGVTELDVRSTVSHRRRPRLIVLAAAIHGALGYSREGIISKMRRLAETCEAIAATTKKLLKTGIVADYLKACSPEEAAVSAVFLSGRAFPAWEETTLQVGGSLLWRVVAELSGKDEAAITAAYRKHGDLGAAAGELLPERSQQGVGVLDVSKTFREIAAAHGPAAKSTLVSHLLKRATPLEAKYIVKIITGDLRIGLKESLVEDAIARAYGATLAGLLKQVQRANMLLG